MEVKNLRAPVGITDAFARAFSRIAGNRILNGFGIVLKHYHDNTVTVAQRIAIDEFVASLPDRTLPFHITLVLPGGVDVEASVVQGGKGVCLVRGIGGINPMDHSPTALHSLAKRRLSFRRVLHSFRRTTMVCVCWCSTSSPQMRCSPTRSASNVQQIVATTSNGSVDLILLHHHSFIEG